MQPTNRFHAFTSLLYRVLYATFGLVVYAFAVYLTIQADIGLAPWNSLNQGLAKHLPITFGQASIYTSVIILVFDFLLKEHIGIGTIIDAVLIGIVVDFLDRIQLIPMQTALPWQLLLLLAGIIIDSLGQCIYMKAALSCGPRDAMLVGLGKRFRSVSIGTINIIIFVTVLLVSVLLGAPVGIGTVIMVFLKGPIMDMVFKLLHFDPREIKHESVLDSLRPLF